MQTKKPKIGDIYEIKVPSGLAYVQYTHDGGDNGQLIRVLPGVYSSRPRDLGAVAQHKEEYFVFYTLAHALRTNQVELVCNQPIPEWARQFPTMRKPWGWSNEEGRATSWHIGHGLRLYTIQEMQQSLLVRELTPEQRKLSITEIWAPSVLIDKIEQRWTPERDEELTAAAREARKERERETGPPQISEPRFIDHYLYFTKIYNADRAAHELRSKGWKVEVKKGADGKSWLALAKQPAPIEQDIEDVREELERLAKELHGEYDGWGGAV